MYVYGLIKFLFSPVLCSLKPNIIQVVCCFCVVSVCRFPPGTLVSTINQEMHNSLILQQVILIISPRLCTVAMEGFHSSIKDWVKCKEHIFLWRQSFLLLLFKMATQMLCPITSCCQLQVKRDPQILHSFTVFLFNYEACSVQEGALPKVLHPHRCPLQ